MTCSAAEENAGCSLNRAVMVLCAELAVCRVGFIC